MISYLLLDLDNTLYPKSSGLGRAMGSRMGEYVVRYLGANPEEATEMRRDGLRRHGTTLRWLVAEHGLTEVEEFIETVHPTDLDQFLKPEDRKRVIEALDRTSLPASILTNSPVEHSRRVLEWLGIGDRFEHVFDLRFNSFKGKPNPDVYTRALEIIERTAGETLFADDVLQYLLPFRDLGGHVVHISAEPSNEPGIETIPSISGLAAVVNQLRSGK